MNLFKLVLWVLLFAVCIPVSQAGVLNPNLVSQPGVEQEYQANNDPIEEERKNNQIRNLFAAIAFLGGILTTFYALIFVGLGGSIALMMLPVVLFVGGGILGIRSKRKMKKFQKENAGILSKEENKSRARTLDRSKGFSLILGILNIVFGAIALLVVVGGSGDN